MLVSKLVSKREISALNNKLPSHIKFAMWRFWSNPSSDWVEYNEKITLVCVTLAFLAPSLSFSHTINGVYASLISCDYSYSSVRGESGYTGTYKARDEIFTQYFGSRYCPS